MKAFKTIKNVLLALSVCTLCSCSGSVSQVMNPFYEPPSPRALQGAASDDALRGNKSSAGSARAALETMATYRRAQSPQPVNPVIQPAVVRLMWVPDHLNSKGDLVPQHYYYLKVLNDRWAVTDAFELQSQLNTSNNSKSAYPYVLGDTK